MTEMESQIPAAHAEHTEPSQVGDDTATPQHRADDGSEARPGRHYRNEGDTGQFTRILGDAPRPAEGTRRHRYREDDEENEVLARVLGR